MKIVEFLSLALAVSSLPANVVDNEQLTFVQEPELRLIELSEDTRAWMSEEQINNLIEKGTGFIDVTDHQDESSFAPVSSVDLPRTPRFPSVITPMLTRLDLAYMRSFLTKFSGFKNRYYDSHGKESAQFLFDTVSEIAGKSQLKITVSKFEHKWAQFSIIARFEPCDSASDETVIVGAHQDSINARSRMEGIAPGADDDGSGTTSILEAFRALAASPAAVFCPKHAVEFHWYSAEEVGLWGSQAVASSYKKAGRKIIGMLQNDMTGYVDDTTRTRGKPHFGLLADYTDKSLSAFVKSLIGQYTKMEVFDTRCGYGCSDHASWTKAGYRSASPFEGMFGEMNHNIHSERDVIENVDFEHAAEFSKLAVSFAVELSS